ncbi:hypothetical protein PSN45_000918 [Yamadazyma tenuis]|uniref:Uncharacterized protein n=1 Tax=Candida tenuis (strain ATCC 10573 / BCRC 21748 / CBS 615 / JCM 9827 / NBRC 10315 / NRRL Y-1498 / VKM Y-70) TaxID=590646 RepID=G3BBN9_CANTC|nr:uncharacterized protein CANTEDRAFT_115661 [Yamadazyma tenuis ATCC 10573]EGV62196.1 hypothetical protein CANTEDRAFT_115661 [Yamadazyma tenuis ATCC 10573]WEJ93455.1 hypothetical protein PSN45_000918 [Yamadazyma tenuis]
MSLSNRVMNMKFMRSADDKKNEVDVEESKRKVLDSSAWALEDSSYLFTKKPVPVQSVGYGSISAFDDDSEEELAAVPVATKRTWGSQTQDHDQETLDEFSSIKPTRAKSRTSKQKKEDVSTEKDKPEITSLQNLNAEALNNVDANDFINSIFKPKPKEPKDQKDQSRKRAGEPTHSKLNKRKRTQKK